MKFSDHIRTLLHAALDGKKLQWRGCAKAWVDFAPSYGELPGFAHFVSNPAGADGYEYRIKPDPIPDKVIYGIAGLAYTETSIRRWVKEEVAGNKSMIVKLTVKTDEDGNETTTAEVI
jgi:hypothetical protein